MRAPLNRGLHLDFSVSVADVAFVKEASGNPGSGNYGDEDNEHYDPLPVSGHPRRN